MLLDDLKERGSTNSRQADPSQIWEMNAPSRTPSAAARSPRTILAKPPRIEPAALSDPWSERNDHDTN